jgi:hypothetical protein
VFFLSFSLELETSMSVNAAVVPQKISFSARRIAVIRAAVGLVWAVVVAIAAGSAGMDLSAGLALLVTAYPVIDVVASLAEAAQGGPAAGRLRFNAAVSTLAAAGLAVAAFGSDVSAVLAVFGAWAIVSGLIQLANAIQRRRTGAREIPMLISGGLSAIVGIAIIASSRGDDPRLDTLAGYAAFGAVLFLIWAYRARTTN